ncbi:MAG: response regulator [Candidatus Omnitrophica bacterium]|nr:response regulator [Candidatus Omnitrophota bacterium]
MDMTAKNVLVVDDEYIIGLGLQAGLGEHGYDVDYVLSGKEALMSVRQKKYDIIFIDKIMPEMDGIETCREIKKISPKSICVFMTGHFDKNSSIREADFVDAGGRTYFLYKPFAKNELKEVIQKALSDQTRFPSV